MMTEHDALPGIAQEAFPRRQVCAEGGAGHACGHRVFGAACVAAVEVSDYLERTGRSETIRVYGTPAEEGGSGKVRMVREGLFQDVDAVLHWHPSYLNDASAASTLANRSAKFRFHGFSTHAAAAPERGRSAPDGVEAMNYMVNLLRQHVPLDSRIRYVIARGGLAPNVVPAFSEVYCVRHAGARVLEGIFERVVQTACGAARGTGSETDSEFSSGTHSGLPNEALASAVHENLSERDRVRYTDTEAAFAVAIRETVKGALPPPGGQERTKPFDLRASAGSTDAADAAAADPTASADAVTWVPGRSAYGWQAVATGRMRIGTRGMALDARTPAVTAANLITDSVLLRSSREESKRRRGPDSRTDPCSETARHCWITGTKGGQAG